MTVQLLMLGVALLVGLGLLPFLLDRLEEGTVTPPAIVTHAVRNPRTSPETAERLVATLLNEAVTGVFARAGEAAADGALAAAVPDARRAPDEGGSVAPPPPVFWPL